MLRFPEPELPGPRGGVLGPWRTLRSGSSGSRRHAELRLTGAVIGHLLPGGSRPRDQDPGPRAEERSTRLVAGESAGSPGVDKKTLAIPLDEVVAGRYDESVYKRISILSQSLGFLS